MTLSRRDFIKAQAIATAAACAGTLASTPSGIRRGAITGVALRAIAADSGCV